MNVFGEMAAQDEADVKLIKAVPGKEKKMVVRRASRQFALYGVFYEGGGEVPAALKGTYTSVDRAERAINAYLKAQAA